MKKIAIGAMLSIASVFLIGSWAIAQVKTVPAPAPKPANPGNLQSQPGAAGTPKSGRPDLVVSKLNYAPESPKENEEITIWAFVKNNGQARAEASTLRLQVGEESAPPVVPVPALDPGREWRAERVVTFGRAGSYRLRATVDAAGALAESNENNNQAEATITVEAFLRPDLVVTKLNYAPGSPYESDTITLRVVVQNKGPGQAEASRLRVQVGGESAPPVVAVPALDPGGEWRFERRIAPMRAGRYRLKATANADGALIEGEADNNVKQTTLTVQAGAAPEPATNLPDLGLTGGTRIGGRSWQKVNTPALTLTPNDVYPMRDGKVQIHLRLEYREYRGKPVNTPFKNRVYFDGQLVYEETVASMDANEMRRSQAVWEIPSPRHNAQRLLKIQIDAEDRVIEANATNNEDNTTITFSGF